MTPERARELLMRQQALIKQLLGTSSSDPAFSKWHRDTEVALERIFGQQSRHVSDFKNVSYSLFAFSSSTTDAEFDEAYRRGLRQAEAILSSFLDELSDYGLGTEAEAEADASDHLKLVERVCLRFHSVARQLRSRHANRETISIEDEYDVQDLLHALFRVHFDDIRPEEWTPSYAGGSSRVDFLLKKEQIVVEVKKARASLKPAELGAQLLVDIARYERHPDCQLLVCFVYDPEGWIGNPVGLERDLEAHSGKLNVRVIVGPKT